VLKRLRQVGPPLSAGHSNPDSAPARREVPGGRN
jgi:hypothetical protein